MNFPDEIKKIRHCLFMMQEGFAKEICVAFSTVNRWEGGKVTPNFNAMKNIKEFCLKHDIDFSAANEAWLNYTVEVKKI